MFLKRTSQRCVGRIVPIEAFRLAVRSNRIGRHSFGGRVNTTAPVGERATCFWANPTALQFTFKAVKEDLDLSCGGYHGVDFRFPWKKRFASGPFGGDIPVLADLLPAPAGRNDGPVRDAVFGALRTRVFGSPGGEVGNHNDGVRAAVRAALPGHNSAAGSEIEVDEAGVVD